MARFVQGQHVGVGLVFHDASGADMSLSGAGSFTDILVRANGSDDVASYRLTTDLTLINPDAGGAVSYATATFAGRSFGLRNDVVTSLTPASVSTSVQLNSNSTGYSGDQIEFLPVEINSTIYYLAAGSSLSGIYTLDDDVGGNFVQRHHRADSAFAYIDGVIGIAHIEVGGVHYIYATSGTEAGISSYELRPNGQILYETSIGSSDGLGIAGVTALQTVSVGANNFLIAGAAGTGTLTVLRPDAGGQMTVVSHVMDDQNSRFGGVRDIASITVNGQTYVVAGGGVGADAGLSVFTMLPGGQLILRDSIADTTSMGLDSVDAVDLAYQNGRLQVIAHSATEGGLTRVEIDLTGAGIVVAGGNGNDVLTGLGADDILYDGAGSDTLTGGGGADLFVLESDGETDTIKDFTPGTDMVDLSGWQGLYGTGQLTITSLPNGARIEYWSETLILETFDGSSLDYDDFLNTDMLGLYQTPELVPDPGGGDPDPNDPMTLIGTNGADTLTGGIADDLIQGLGSNDLLTGDAGADTIEGFSGADTIHGNTGADQLFGGNGNDSINGGSAEDLIRGGAGGDYVSGGTGADTIYGEGGNDTIYGNTGVDIIDGGDGADYVSAGDGVDTVYGGAGNDDIIGRSGWDVLYGGDGNDTLKGSSGDDRLYGGNDDDLIEGGSAWDYLVGGAGDDTLYGNFGADQLYGGAGSDQLHGGSGVDTLSGGTSSDTLYGMEGVDHLYGDDGDDLVVGGSGDDQIYGGDGDDTLQGNQGVDLLRGGGGNDVLRGGTLSDTFVFGKGEGADTIEDFNAAEDILQLSNDLTAATTGLDVVANHAQLSDGNVVLTMTGSSVITLQDFSDLTALAAAIDLF